LKEERSKSTKEERNRNRRKRSQGKELEWRDNSALDDRVREYFIPDSIPKLVNLHLREEKGKVERGGLYEDLPDQVRGATPKSTKTGCNSERYLLTSGSWRKTWPKETRVAQ